MAETSKDLDPDKSSLFWTNEMQAALVASMNQSSSSLLSGSGTTPVMDPVRKMQAKNEQESIVSQRSKKNGLLSKLFAQRSSKKKGLTDASSILSSSVNTNRTGSTRKSNDLSRDANVVLGAFRKQREARDRKKKKQSELAKAAAQREVQADFLGSLLVFPTVDTSMKRQPSISSRSSNTTTSSSHYFSVQQQLHESSSTLATQSRSSTPRARDVTDLSDEELHDGLLLPDSLDDEGRLDKRWSQEFDCCSSREEVPSEIPSVTAAPSRRPPYPPQTPLLHQKKSSNVNQHANETSWMRERDHRLPSRTSPTKSVRNPPVVYKPPMPLCPVLESFHDSQMIRQESESGDFSIESAGGRRFRPYHPPLPPPPVYLQELAERVSHRREAVAVGISIDEVPLCCADLVANLEPPRPVTTQQTLFEDHSITVAPGVTLPLRSSQETLHYIATDRLVQANCSCCRQSLLCMEDAEFILCPSCRSIETLCYQETRGRGVALGMTVEDWEECRLQMGM